MSVRRVGVCSNDFARDSVFVYDLNRRVRSREEYRMASGSRFFTKDQEWIGYGGTQPYPCPRWIREATGVFVAAIEINLNGGRRIYI